MIVALGMSYLSWRWVENVFRHKREKNRLSVSVFGYATLSIMSLCGLGWVIDSTAGWQGRWTAASLRSLVSQKEKYLYAPPKGNDLLRELINGSVPRLGSVAVEAPMHVLIWGDSHAQSLVPALDASCTRRGLAGLWVSFGSTPPLLDYISPSPFGMKERIPTVGEAVLKLVKERQVAHVLLVAQWQTYWSEHAKKGTLPIFKSALEKTIQRLLAETHAQVWLVKDVPVHEINIPRALALHSAWPWALPDPTKLVSGREKHLVRNAEFDVFADTLKSIGAGLFDASTLLIDADGRCLIEENGKPLYFDNNHLSVLGAARLAPTFNVLFQTEDKP